MKLSTYSGSVQRLKSEIFTWHISIVFIWLNLHWNKTIYSVQFSHSVTSNSLQPHELQHARPLYPSPTPGVHSNSCPLSRWCHTAISSSYRPLLLLPPIPPSIRVFSKESTLRMRWPKYWSFSFSIIPSKEIPGLISFSMDWLDLLALDSLSLDWASKSYSDELVCPVSCPCADTCLKHSWQGEATHIKNPSFGCPSPKNRVHG